MPNPPPETTAAAIREEEESALAQLLVELAFLVPKGTNFGMGSSFAAKFGRYVESVRATVRADLLDAQARQQAISDARVLALTKALEDLRDWFAYGQGERTGMQAVTTPRCSPSAWKEIKRRVDAILAASSDPPATGEQP